MRIEAHLIHWQEKDIMPFVIRHYQEFCDKIFIYDNHSKDGSTELAVSMGCEVIPFGNQWFDDAENMKVKNECWKGSKADWVVVADFDEVLFYQYGNLRENLKLLNMCGVSIPLTIGWQIMCDEMPQEGLLEITNGYEFENYSKSIIFNPQRIREMNYNPGAHRCNPMGYVIYSECELHVLHYKHIGGVQRTIDRYKTYQKRMSPNNRKNGWGIHYNRTPASLRQEWDERMAKSKPLI